MAELKKIEVIMRIDFAGTDGKQICAHAEKVQELVRCKDCLYWQQNTVRQNSNDAGWWNEALCERHTIYGNEPHEAWTDADWYCADGERREG